MPRILAMIFFIIILIPVVTPISLYAQVNDDQDKSERISYSYFTKISTEDLATKYFYIPESTVVDSYITSIRIDKFGDSRKAPAGLRTIYPYRIDGDIIGTSRINPNLTCIPFHGGIDEESTLFTFWRIENDSLVFDHLYQNIFSTKYAYMCIDTALLLDYTNILIGNTYGGEGGEMWKELWIAKESSATRMVICQRYLKGWDSDGQIRYSIDFDLTSHNINIQIVEYSVEISRTQLDTINSKTVMNEQIDLTTIVSSACN